MTFKFSFAPLFLVLAAGVPGHAQFAGSGSNGSDGALVLTTPGITLFDPRVFSGRLNSAANNIFQFTSVYIGQGVVVKLSSAVLQGPVFWLSQGSVQIDGIVDLNGSAGGPKTALAGAGGFPGGAPRKSGYKPENFRPNVFLIPLVGGFGGDGGETQGGGAGGGALLIASSASITVNGMIMADGGLSSDGMGGNGGAIRLVAPEIDGSGVLSAKGGSPEGADGLVRFETLQNQFSGFLNNTPTAQGKPLGLFLPPSPQPTVKVISIGGATADSKEITLHERAPVLVVVEARFIPPGTIIQLEFFAENGASQVISTSPLEGTLELSHATASVTFPKGLSDLQVRATWKHPELTGSSRKDQ